MKGEQPTFLYRMRKLRMWFAWPFVIVLAVYAESSTQGFLLGLPLILAGEGLRIWSHGYLRKIRKLAISGPYAYVRNPLYVGNFLIGFGFCVVIWELWVATLFTIGFGLVYWVTIKGEEEKLAKKFGEAYRRYAESVPRIIPQITPYRSGSRGKFVAHRVWGHGELITVLAIADLFVLLYLRQELYQYGNSVTELTFIALVLALGLGLGSAGVLVSRRSRGRLKVIRYKNYVSRRWRNWQTRKI
jgi:protein-S-isoprenylcysteine O-methyltransferase Ste14